MLFVRNASASILLGIFVERPSRFNSEHVPICELITIDENKSRLVPGATAMSGNFGWSLSDATNPRLTGLANLRYKLLTRQDIGVDGDEETAPTSLTSIGETACSSCYFVSDEQALTTGSIRRCRCHYSQSRCSDSCTLSEYPSLTSTGRPT